jgi:NADH-quinone oxidoreductase subunit I
MFKILAGGSVVLRCGWYLAMQHVNVTPFYIQKYQPNKLPRFRGRIVLTRDPDGEERCVACNLCAVACPVGCISLQKAEKEDGRWYPEFFRINFSRCIFCGMCEEACQRLQFS